MFNKKTDLFAELIDNVSLFETFETEWEKLRICAGIDHPQFSHKWLLFVCNQLRISHPKFKLKIIRIHDGVQAIAFIPLIVRKISFRKWFHLTQLSFLGGDYSDYCGWIIKSEDADRVSKYFFKEVLNNKEIIGNWDSLLFKGISSRFVSIETWKNILESSENFLQLIEKSKYFYVKIDKSFDEFINDLSKKFRKDLRVTKKRLEQLAKEQGVSYQIVVENSASISHESIGLLISWQIDRMKTVGKVSNFNDSLRRQFLYDCIRSKSAPVFSVGLDLDGKRIAMCLAIEYKTGISFWIQGYDERYASVSPIKLLIYRLIQYCYEKNLSICDFGQGSYAYKQRWTDSYYTSFVIKGYNYNKWYFRFINYLKKI